VGIRVIRHSLPHLDMAFDLRCHSCHTFALLPSVHARISLKGSQWQLWQLWREDRRRHRD
jgi:hypothetical protein